MGAVAHVVHSFGWRSSSETIIRVVHLVGKRCTSASRRHVGRGIVRVGEVVRWQTIGDRGKYVKSILRRAAYAGINDAADSSLARWIAIESCGASG